MSYLWLFMLFVNAVLFSSLGYSNELPSGITLDKPWQNKLHRFAQQYLQHSAWGLAHYQRNYLLTKEIAEQENIPFDNEVVFAAAFLHDLGVFEHYVIDGAEHSQTAVDNIDNILLPMGFAREKLPAVKSLVLTHMFYAKTSENKLAQAFHDADTLDFLGTIGIVRILSITTRHRWAPNLSAALTQIEKFNRQLPAKLRLATSKRLAIKRVTEAQLFLQRLQAESYYGTAL